MHVTATQAKNRFGAICAQAKTEPVFVEKDGRIDTVILSAKQFSELQAAKSIESLSQRKAQFEQSHSAWLAEQTSVLNRMGCGATTCASGKPVCSLIFMKTPARVCAMSIPLW